MITKIVYQIKLFSQKPYEEKNLFSAIICRGFGRVRLARTQYVNHVLLHLLEDLLQLGILQHQGPLTRFIIAKQGFVHFSFVAAQKNGYQRDDGTCNRHV